MADKNKKNKLNKKIDKNATENPKVVKLNTSFTSKNLICTKSNMYRIR